MKKYIPIMLYVLLVVNIFSSCKKIEDFSVIASKDDSDSSSITVVTTNSAIEMPRGIRINVVSPTVLTESLDKYADYFKGFESVPAARVALAFRKSVDGAQTGQTYRVW